MTAEPGGDHQLSFARAYAGAAHSDQALADLEGLLDGSLDIDGLAVDTDLRWTLLSALAKNGRADAARIDEELARDNTISGKEHAAAARAAAPDRRGQGRGVGARDGPRRRTERDPAQHRAGLPGLRPGRGARAVRREVPRRRRHACGRRRAPSAPRPRWSTSSPSSSPARPSSTGVDAWLESSPANPAAKRYVRENRDDVARALRAQAKDAEQPREADDPGRAPSTPRSNLRAGASAPLPIGAGAREWHRRSPLKRRERPSLGYWLEHAGLRASPPVIRLFVEGWNGFSPWSMAYCCR